MANPISIIEQIGLRESKTFSDRINLGYSRFSTGLYTRSPYRIRRFVPTVVSKITLPVKDFPQVRQELLAKFAQPESGEISEDLTLEKPATPLSFKPLYSQYRCLQHNPLRCEEPQRSLRDDPNASHCRQCGFPCLVPADTKIQGLQSAYQIESYCKSRGRGRLYQGIDLSDRQPVTIREYLLPDRYFSQEERRIRQAQFLNLAGIELADGQVKDFRILRPDRVFAPLQENRCYAIALGNIETYPTLATYLEQTGAMSAKHVRSVLLQVLQSLEFLHGQKFRFPSGVMQHGIFHGNLTLESLLFVPNPQGFYIYLADLGIWEHLFSPPLLPLPFISIQQDLKQLGEIAFYLLAGRAVEEDSGYPLNPAIASHWPEINPEFKAFILGLMGIGSTAFSSAEIARQALLKLPSADSLAAVMPLSLVAQKTPKSQSRKKLWLWLLGGLGIVLLAWLIWFLIARSRRPQPLVKIAPICCVDQISGVGAGNFAYTGVKTGVWTYVLQRENLIAKGQTLEAELQQRIVPTEPEKKAPESASSNPTPSPDNPPQFNLIYRPQANISDAIAPVREGKADFAIAARPQNLDIYLGYEEFAYDALTVYVAFSYAARTNSIPQHLNGQLSFEQLRQLYTGQIVNWRQLGGPDLPVRLYIPDDAAAVRIFERRVLQDRRSISTFRALIQPESATGRTNSLTPRRITPLATFRSLKTIIRDFEEYNVGSISFGSLSQIFGQCSVYPLALVVGEQPPVAPLVTQGDRAISPQTDLCNQKGNYHPNIEALVAQRYPLTYPLAVIYPRDNRREPIGQTFAEILKTTEIQGLLSKAGLVPLEQPSAPDG